MSIQVISRDAAVASLKDNGTVAIPLSEPACKLRGLDVAIAGRPEVDTGFWECAEGQFRRAVDTGEVMYILEGSGSFMPDSDEEPTIEFKAGDTLFFPPFTRGVWDIREKVRKLYVMV